MDLTLDDDQLLLAESARQLFERTYTTESAREAEEQPDGFSADLWKQAVELGWPGIALPEDVGGAGYGLLELAILAEELGRGAATLPLLSSYAATLPALARLALRARLELASGDADRRPRRWSTRSATNPCAPPPPTTDGSSRGRRWRCRSARSPTCSSCSVDLDATDRGPSLVAVAADAPGVTRARHDTFAPTPYASVTFDQVAVTPRRRGGRRDRARPRARAPDRRRHRVRGRPRRRRARARGRPRDEPRAVRPADRREPGGVAPVRRHARRDRRHAGARVAGRVATRPALRRRHPARAVALANAYARDVLPGIFTRRTRCTARSGSRWSTTCSCSPAGPRPTS